MLNFINRLAAVSYSFDPGMLDIGKDFFIVAGKYAMVFGIMAFVLRMVIRAAIGKERFL